MRSFVREQIQSGARFDRSLCCDIDEGQRDAEGNVHLIHFPSLRSTRDKDHNLFAVCIFSHFLSVLFCSFKKAARLWSPVFGDRLVCGNLQGPKI